MGFCTEAEYQEFMGSVSDFEHMLVRSGVKLLKYYLDISKPEQKQRLNERKSDPLTQWKVSTLDNLALKKWNQYSLARDEMLTHTHNPIAPWNIVRADDKYLARINIMKDILSHLHYADKDEWLILPDPKVVFAYDISSLENGQLAR